MIVTDQETFGFSAFFELERPLVSKKVVLRPEKLTAEFHTVNGSLVGQFSWQLAQNAPGQTPIAGFQFTWAQLSVGAGVAMSTEGQDFLISQTQIVAPVRLCVFVCVCVCVCVY